MATRSQIARWGNSLAIRIPKSVAESAGFREGDALVMEVKRPGILAVKAVARARTLDELVAQITPENLHAETNWGSPVGHENW